VAKESKRKSRLIKKAETVREKVERTAAPAAEKPRRLRKHGRRVAAPLRVVGRSAKRLGRLKIFRIIGLILCPPYFRRSFHELRQVTWPSRRESIQLTSAVIVFAVIFGALIAVTDFGLGKLFKEVLLK
jgi:preprotein translocase SecE subunit